jgi:hypothetical protein
MNGALHLLENNKYAVMKKFVVTFLGFIVVNAALLCQEKFQFSGDAAKFKDELLQFLGSQTTDNQKLDLQRFIILWDSTAFNSRDEDLIVNVASQMRARNMRPAPSFYTLMHTLSLFHDEKLNEKQIRDWLMSLSEIIFDPRYTSIKIDKYIEISGLFVKNKTLYDGGSIRWQVKEGKAEFARDTTLQIHITNATITCYSIKDSLEIYNFNGDYYPDMLKLQCKTGLITWEKAGFARDKVFAYVYSFFIDVTQNSYSCDSSMLTHKTYFKIPVAGKLTDKATFAKSPEESTYPRFETYETKFKIKNIYKDVDYEGGIGLEGAIVHGMGSSYNPAKLNLYRNDTLYVKITSKSFILAKKNLKSIESTATLYLDKDSIYHSNLDFSYIPETREMSLYRTQSPISKSPYFDSFHNLDMTFENLFWDMDNSYMVMSRPKSASIGQAKFESTSFYNEKNFFKLMRLEEVHPLYLLRDFAKKYGSETFPVEALAKWMKMSVEQAVAMCIEMANNGFLFYDRSYNEVTIKKKVDDYIASFAKKKDYDDITINSETSGKEQNAILDMKSYKMTICGVPAVFLSDSQKVAIFPYGGKLVVGKNRTISFDGVVQAGLFTIFGKNFTFRYDTFYLRLQKIDSIRIAVETGEKDAFGKPKVEEINNLIQLGTANLYIDDPKNKSGLKSLKQYPIINAITYSYIFYDKIPGLEGIYPQKDFYFRVDPFTYTNIDHYSNRDISLDGEFIGGKIVEPMRQTLSIQPDNSLGFSMVVPQAGLPVYSDKGVVFDYLSMSNKGLISSGKLNRLTSVTVADTFRFYPDSMKTHAMSFNMTKNENFPDLVSVDVAIKWLTDNDVWYARNSHDKEFNMYSNGTTMDGVLKLCPASLSGDGVVNMTDSRITSGSFIFKGMNIDADTSDYYLKALKGNGYGFVATNVNTHVNFDTKHTSFSLNTDSSLVVLPEIEYICKMTNFDYNMNSKTLQMWQKGRESTTLMPAEKLIKIPLDKTEKPTFFSTNNMKDTVSFASGTGTYYLAKNYMKIDNVNYVKVADALIQPGGGTLIISSGAKIKQTDSSLVAINNRHIIHSASIKIESSAFYSGGGIYDYIDAEGNTQTISFPKIEVDTMATSAKGYIPDSQHFTLSPAFTFIGDVTLRSSRDNLSFTGAAGIITKCEKIKSLPVKFSAVIDPRHILIPVGEKARDINDNLIYSGSFVSLDTAGVYGTFLSERNSWSDNPLVTSSGYLFFDKGAGKYRIASLAKLSDLNQSGSMVSFDKDYCILSGEGKINYGTNYDLLKMEGAGKVIHQTDSTNLSIQSLLGFSFFFSPEALKMMADEIKTIPTLKTVNVSTDFYRKAFRDLVGEKAATSITEDLQLLGHIKTMPKEFSYQIFLNDVNMVWNPETMSFISKGKIGIGFIGETPLNVYVDGYIELQRKRSGDLLDIYLKANDNTWYWFSYFRGVMMSLSSNRAYDDILSNLKESSRKHPDSSARTPYKYMIGVQDRLNRFMQRMSGKVDENDSEER